MDPFMIVMLVAMLGLLFFMQSRAKKQAAQRDAFRTTLAPGQRVMTQGGLVGTIVSVNDAADTVIIESAGSRCEYKRQGIAKTLDASDLAGTTQYVAQPATIVENPQYGAHLEPVAVEAAAAAAGGFLANALGNLQAATNPGPVVDDADLAELDEISRDYHQNQGQAGNVGPVVVIEEE